MSKLAASLTDVTVPKALKIPRSPCFSLYGYGDQEDLQAVLRLQEEGAEWAQIQTLVDEALNIDSPIDERKFVRHWRAKCSCWQ